MSGTTLFEREPESTPVGIVLTKYALAYDDRYLREYYHDPEWQLDMDTLCETPEAVEQLVEEFCDSHLSTQRIVALEVRVTGVVRVPRHSPTPAETSQ